MRNKMLIPAHSVGPEAYLSVPTSVGREHRTWFRVPWRAFRTWQGIARVADVDMETKQEDDDEART